jgi:Phage integrase family
VGVHRSIDGAHHDPPPEESQAAPAYAAQYPNQSHRLRHSDSPRADGGPADRVRLREGRTGKAPSIRRAYETAVAGAGIKDFTFHDLRHTTASQLILAGATLQEVKDILGHSDIKLTLRYAHLNPAQLWTAVARLDFRLPAAKPVLKPVAGSDAGSDEGSRVDTRLVPAENHYTPP